MLIPNAQTKVLDNGLTILTEDISALRSVAMGILVGAGSGEETPRESGISHFIEHMTFKGTQKRSAYDIAHALDAVGGKINAYTSKEYTMYYAVVLDKHIDIAIDVLQDILLNSTFEPSAMEMEKGVILEEIKMYEDTPDELIHDFFIENILHGHSLGKPIIGLKETVQQIKQADILDYRKKWYVPRNCIVSLAGGIPADAMQRITDNFSRWQGTEVAKPLVPMQIKGSIRLKRKTTEQVHLCLGFKGVSQIDEDRYPYAVLDSILGGSMSSWLFQEVREKRGLVYSIFSTSSPFRDTGVAYVYAGTSKENMQQVIEIILAQFAKLKKAGVSVEELSRAKEYLKGTLVLGLESTSARMSWLAKAQYYYQRIMTIDEIFEKVDKITNEDIIRLANKFFRNEYLTLAVIADFDRLPMDKLVIPA